MALGSLASLGVGSGVLNWDTLNSMKELEVQNLVNPYATKLQTNMQQQTELTALMSLMSSVNSNFRALSDYSTFQKRSATVEGTGVKATAGDGLPVQDITIKVDQLAQNDVNQVGKKFQAKDSVFSNENTQLKFYHNGTDYTIDIKAGATLTEVAQSITDATDGAVNGIIMNTGGDNPYQLMIQSKDSGEKNKIYFGSTLSGAAIPGGEIQDEGTFKVTIGGKEIEIQGSEIDSKVGNDSKQNAQALLDAINKKIDEDPSLSDIKEKRDSGEITIGLNKDGNGLMFNDSKGGEIKVVAEGIKVKPAEGTTATDSDLGFGKKSSVGSSSLITGKKGVDEGELSGVFTINGEKFDLAEISKNGTGANNAEKIINAINSNSNLQGKVEAKMENGKLVINSLDGGTIRISSEGENDEAKKKVLDQIGLSSGAYTPSSKFLESLDITSIQKGQDAKFSFNGIPITRDKNTVDDVISGLSLELTAVTKENEEVTVRIGRDDTAILDEAKAFVENYNAMILKIQELTKYDEETKIAGPFNGNSEIRSITRELNSLLSSNDLNGNNLVKFGIYFNDDGTLKLDSSTFTSEFQKDPDAAVEFFRGSTSTINGNTEEVPGVFAKLKTSMDSLITGSDSTLKTLEQQLINENKSLTEGRDNAMEQIDTRYEMMAARWSAYDQLIAKTNQSASAVTNMINAMNNSN